MAFDISLMGVVMTNRFSLILLLLLFTVSVLIPGVALASSIQDNLYDDYGVELNGFVEFRLGNRLQEDPYEKDASLSEVRLQLEAAKDLDWGILKLKGDLVGDVVRDQERAELREFNLFMSPLVFMDLKMGRQVLTWGTGDLLFINDLFPKDWVSFFIGRDDEYLKAPSDAAKLSFFFDVANLDVVYVPVFNGSVYIDGTRVSYWNPILGRQAGRDFIFSDQERNRFFQDSELALRIYRNIGGAEFALYAYDGFWKTPEGLAPGFGRLFYPEMTAYGASVRAPFAGGIGNLELGYYESSDDHNGDDPFIRNSEFRFLMGFEREIARDFTGGIQYYLEWMDDYDAYRDGLGSQRGRDEYRHLATIRLTKLLMNQNLRLSLFAYVSPSDEDAYFRPKLHYKVNDHWAVEVGGNLFLGADEDTFFGQFDNNTNVYGGVRWNF